MPLKHEDRMLVIKAINDAIKHAEIVENDNINVKLSSLRVIAELVQECNEIVAGHEYKLVMKGDYQVQGLLEDEIHEALVAAGWTPPPLSPETAAFGAEYMISPQK